MLYLQESLSPGEKIIKLTHYHWMYMVSAFFWAGCFLAFGGGLIFLGLVYHYYDIVKLPPWQIMQAASELSAGDYLRAFRHIHILIRVSAFIFVLMALITVGASLLVCKTTEMGVTNRRLVLKRGLVSRRVEEIRTEYVESADMNQGILGRIFDFGQVKVYGTGTEEIYFPKYTADPVGFRRAIQTARAHHVQPVSVVANPAAKHENEPVPQSEVSDSTL